ncbi:hypothetical protein TBLA_0C05650 [Henningerozyma blattae CBS 6284]|uniref:Autophagy-related protein 27 n=1 Tax=Henningerozyma blattae (strain ATCC 34711 / CBS 6284 / DSM 70876 / NBRC 10599 / NRRL Y-10934 / UCD 77-7) TaxID=1071380 RepID=I2H1W1_HENB6|nr:hypothetical protein TBLA_0C05650 [Tetrapisispora blattae CBS 6284]CCH60363.1 hypothetical protein TBLA_0C05650 [Tetrapisispora blattae CBS 6284]
MKNIKLISLLAATLLFTPIYGINCDNDEILKKYNLSKNPAVMSAVIDIETPPTLSHQSIWFNLCDSNKNGDKSQLSKSCNGNDMVCIFEEIETISNSNEKMISKLIDIPYSTDFDVTGYENDGVTVSLSLVKWGKRYLDVQLQYVCDNSLKNDEISQYNWNKDLIDLQIKGPSGCLNVDNGGNDVNTPQETKGTSLFGWFIWLLIYAVLFSLTFVAITSYLKTRESGSFEEFRDEFVTRLSDLVRSLPGFVNEVINKVIGRGSINGSIREGYSAV